MRKSVLVILAAILVCALASGAFAEGPKKIDASSVLSGGPAVRSGPPMLGKLAGTVGTALQPHQKKRLSGMGANLVIGPARPVSPDDLSKMREERLKRIKAGSRRSELLNSSRFSSAPANSSPGVGLWAVVSKVVSRVVALVGSNYQRVNDRNGWLEDYYTTAVTQSETSSAVYGSHIVAGWNDLDTLYFGNQASTSNWAVSHDGGVTFTEATNIAGIDGLPTGGALTETWGDPAVDVGSSGYFYYGTMHEYTPVATSYSAVGYYKSTDFGNSFVYQSGWYTGDTADFYDKPYLVVDRVNNKVYMTWTWFNNVSPLYNILCWNATDSILTTVASNDTGLQGSIPAVDNAGNLYVAYEYWTGGGVPYIRVQKSVNFGTSFGGVVIAAGPLNGAADWNANYDASLFCGRDAIKGNIRINEFPSMAVDTRASGTGAGYIYIAYNDRDGSGNLDVYLVRSTNGGASFGAPVMANSRAVGDYSDKFFPWITVTGTGKIGLTFSERKLSLAGGGPYLTNNNWWVSTFVRRFNSSLALIDGMRVGPPFPVVVNNDWTSDCYMGDYNSISANRAAAGDGLFLFWGDNRQGDPDIRFVKVTP